MPPDRPDCEDVPMAADCGAPTFVHTGIQTSHAKGGIYVREQEFRRQQTAAA